MLRLRSSSRSPTWITSGGTSWCSSSYWSPLSHCASHSATMRERASLPIRPAENPPEVAGRAALILGLELERFYRVIWESQMQLLAGADRPLGMARTAAHGYCARIAAAEPSRHAQDTLERWWLSQLRLALSYSQCAKYRTNFRLTRHPPSDGRPRESARGATDRSFDMSTEELVQAAAQIAGAMAGAAYASSARLSPEAMTAIVRTSVQMAREIEKAAQHAA
jgi:hypothetical protein